jgi:sugar lactone lactonase YvrE
VRVGVRARARNPNPYTAIEQYFTLPDGRPWGSTTAVEIDPDGTSIWFFGEEWKTVRAASGIFIDRNVMLYVADHQSNEKVNMVFKKGIRIGSSKDGKVTAFILDPDPNGSQEGVAADAKGNVYSTLTGGMAVKKYFKRQ